MFWKLICYQNWNVTKHNSVLKIKIKSKRSALFTLVLFSTVFKYCHPFSKVFKFSMHLYINWWFVEISSTLCKSQTVAVDSLTDVKVWEWCGWQLSVCGWHSEKGWNFTEGRPPWKTLASSIEVDAWTDVSVYGWCWWKLLVCGLQLLVCGWHSWEEWNFTKERPPWKILASSNEVGSWTDVSFHGWCGWQPLVCGCGFWCLISIYRLIVKAIIDILCLKGSG